MTKHLEPDKIDRLTRIFLCCIIIWALSLIPFKIVSTGFLPIDDSLSSAAKVVSGKGWQDILVLRDAFKMDNHPGWHAILGFVHRLTGWNTHSLVLFSIISLFLLFTALPILYLRRPEAWIMALLTLSMTTGFIFRLVLGRPYIVFMTSVFLICSSWKKLEERKPYKTIIAITIAIALSTWIHASWYLFGIPLLAFLAARKWRVSINYALAIVFGTFLGACLTGRPLTFIIQNFEHFFIVFGSASHTRQLVTELMPFGGDMGLVMLISLLLLWRNARNRWSGDVINNPVFILAAICWPLGFIASRTWSDIGLVAVASFIYTEFQDLLDNYKRHSPGKRVIFTLIAIMVLYLATTNDGGYRWSSQRPFPYLSQEDPKVSKLLPEGEGVIYSDNMGVFFSTFYKNPKAPWKYILGFESAMMPKDDLAILRNIQTNFGSAESYQPWVNKMRPEDRLIIGGSSDKAPDIKGLKWDKTSSCIWIGRKE